MAWKPKRQQWPWRDFLTKDEGVQVCLLEV